MLISSILIDGVPPGHYNNIETRFHSKFPNALSPSTVHARRYIDMKKLLSLLAACLLLFSCALAEPVTIDPEAMTIEELTALRADIDAALLKAYAAQGVSGYAATRENPAPVGAAVRYDGSAYYNRAVTDLTVTEVLRGDAAWRLISSFNSYNARPGQDQEYIVVTVRATAVAAPEGVQAELYPYDFTFISAEGAQYEYAYAADVSRELTNLYEGASCEGYVIGLISKGDRPLLAYLHSSDHPLWFDPNAYEPIEITTEEPLATLQRGMISEDVRAMQQALITMGYLNDAADGNFGRKTEAAVMAYQEAMGLEATGVADDALLRLILTGTKPE